MKYITVVLITVIALVGIAVSVAADVTDAQYLSKILVSNNSTTEANQVALAYSINTTAMADSAMLGASATDVILQDVAGVSRAVMPGHGNNPWIMYIDTIEGNTQQRKFLYTGGGLIGDNLVYFPGPDALKVTDDDSIELKDVFSLSLADVLLKDSGPVFDKPGAVDGDYDSATENLSVQVTEGTENVTLTATGVDQIEYADVKIEQVRNSLDNDEWWLWGWKKRIAFTIDETYIDSDLTFFPVLISLNSVDVFNEVGANGLKIAVTESDKQTQLYVDEVSWVTATHTAELWVSRSGWVISSTENTTIYLYYDNSQPDNTTYVGLSGGTAAQSVWDSHYRLVDHMKDNTTSSTFDSTSYNRDGTKGGADHPYQVDGIIGKAQDFQGLSTDTLDYTVLAWGESTIEWFMKQNADAQYDIWAWKGSGSYVGIWYTAVGFGSFPAKSTTLYLNETGGVYQAFDTPTLSDGTWHYMSMYVPPGATFTQNGVLIIDTNTASTVGGANGTPATWSTWKLGKSPPGTLNAILDEVRVTDGSRSAAWSKATYYACKNLLTSMTGTEEWEYTLSLLVDDVPKDSVAR
jgi:hypothetical protein